MEYVISEERLRRIISRAYKAGEAGVEVYTQVWADGPEVIRCRDCKWYLEGATPNDPDCRYDFCTQFGFDFNRTDGFCSWAERGQYPGAMEVV